MTFLCDRMLARLAKWLRAAGYDAELAGPDEDDAALLRRARGEGRILLTCDRRLKREGAPSDPGVVLLASSDPDEAAPELARLLGLDWQREPFTRCLEDNAPLRRADASETAEMPAVTGALPGPFMACPACGRLYWPGSHVRRMRAKLALWSAAG